jgi:ribonuclease HI
LSARDLITKGSVWRIGTGKDIRIWRDKWLIGSNNQRIISTPPLHTSLSHVEHLIDSDLKSWKTELVKELFLPQEVTTILGIPLSFRNPADSLIWGATKQRIYTVRSGYHLLLHERNQDEPGTSDTTRMSQLWKTIWSVQIPSKIRHFLWRACHSSLPTRSNLHHRHVLDDPRCSSCTDQIESTIHALWQCKSIAPIWHSISWGQTLSKTSYTDCIDLIYQCTLTLSTNELQLFAVICWSIWYRRNRLRLQQPADTNTQLVRRARETLLEFHAAQDRGKQRSMQPNSTTVIKWKPPEVSRYKVNYDGAVFSDRNEAGIGVIIRNHRGEVMGALSQRIPYPHSVEAVEASAARSAIQFAKDSGFTNIDLEGDSTSIVEAIQLTTPCSTIYGNLIEDIRHIARGLQSVQFLHVKREGNVMAHLLAKRAGINKPFETWMESVPPELSHTLCTDFHLE